MGYAKNIGRVGALAIALGVGGAVSQPFVGWADGSGPASSAGSAGDSSVGNADSSGTQRKPRDLNRSKVRQPARKRTAAAVDGAGVEAPGSSPQLTKALDQLTNPARRINGRGQRPDPAPAGTAAVLQHLLGKSRPGAAEPGGAAAAVPPTSQPTSARRGALAAQVVAAAPLTANIPNPNASAALPQASVAVVSTTPVSTGQVNPMRTFVLRVLGAFGFNPAPGATNNPLLEAMWGMYRRSESFFDNKTPTVTGAHVVSTSLTVDGHLAVKLAVDATDEDGDTLAYHTGDGQSGTLTSNGDGTFTYLTEAGYRGTDTITVRTADTGFHFHGLFAFLKPSFGHTATTTLTVTIAAPANTAPAIGAATDPTADPRTGVLTGSLNVTDAEHDALIYQVTTAPSHGTVAIDAATGTYTYTATDATRLQNALTPTVEHDGFAYTVTDSKSAPVAGAVTLTEPTAQLVAVDPIAIDNPQRVLASPDGTHLFVLSTEATGTKVNILDAAGSPVSTPIMVLTSPSWPTVAVTPDGSKLYLADASAGTVTAVDVVTGAVGTPIAVGSVPVGIVATATHVYVANAGGHTVSVIAIADGSVNAAPIAVGTAPFGLALSPDGSKLYVGNSGAGTVSVLNTTDNSIDPNVIQTGGTPSWIAVSPDGKQLRVVDFNGHSVSVFDTQTRAVIGSPVSVGNYPLGMVMSPDGSVAYVSSASPQTVTAIDTRTNAVIGTPLHVNGSAAYLGISADGAMLYLPDSTAVQVLHLATTTGQPVGVATPPTVGAPNATGAVSGSLGIVDPDGDPLTVQAINGPSSGTVTFGPDGSYTYTPNLGAQLLATVTGPVEVDRFTATVGDGVNQPVTVTVNNIPVAPAHVVVGPAGTPPAGATAGSTAISPDGSVVYTLNSANGTVSINVGNTLIDTIPVGTSPVGLIAGPDGTVYVTNAAGQAISTLASAPAIGAPPVESGQPTPGAPDSEGVVSGSLNVTDPDGDALSYNTIGGPSYGSVSYDPTQGTFIYTPTDAAQHAAAAPGGITSDSFTVRVSDGSAGAAILTIPVTIKPENKPIQTAPTTPAVQTDGKVTGSVGATDGDLDGLTYIGPVGNTAHGSVVVNSDGSYVYTPRPADQHAASADNASPAAKTDVFTITVKDGHGSTVPVQITVPVTPTDQAPTLGTPTIGTPASTDGRVTGALNVTDPDYDAMTYTVTGIPAKGIVTVANGTYTYTPNPQARLDAYSSTGDDVDSFSVTVDDKHGKTVVVTVENVPVSPAGAAVISSVSYPSGYYFGGQSTGPDGKKYLTVNDPTNGVQLVVVDPADPQHPTLVHTASGTASGAVYFGSDGRGYQISYTGTTVGTYQSALTVINPNDLNHPTVVNLGSGQATSAVYQGTDGKVYVNLGNAADDHGRLVRIDTANPANSTVIDVGAGIIYSTPVFDGNTAYLATYTSGPSQTTNLVRINGNGQLSILTTTAGTPIGRPTVNNGDVYQQSRLSGDSYLGVSLADGSTPFTSGALAGVNINYAFYANSFTGPDGVHYVSTRGAAGYLIVVNPATPTQGTVVTLPGSEVYGTPMYAPDGTLYLTSYAYNSGYTYYVSRIDADAPASATHVAVGARQPTLIGASNNVAFLSTPGATASAPGSVWVMRSDSSGAMEVALPNTSYRTAMGGDQLYVQGYDSNQWYLNAIDSSGMLSTTPMGASGGPRLLASSTGYGYLVADGTQVLVFTPGSATPTTVALAGQYYQDAFVGTDGNVVVVSASSAVVSLNVFTPSSPTTSTPLSYAGVGAGSGRLGPDGKYYLTIAGGTDGTRVLVFDLAHTTTPVVIDTGGKYANYPVQFAANGHAYQQSYDSVGSVSHGYLSVIDPADPTHPKVLDLGVGVPGQQNIAFTADGSGYLMTTDSSGGNANITSKLVRINPDATAVAFLGTANGSSWDGPRVTSDGVVYVDSQRYLGNALNMQLLIVTPQRPDQAAVVTLPSAPQSVSSFSRSSDIDLGPDGTSYLNWQFRIDNQVTAKVFVIIDGNDPAHQVTVTLPGTNYPGGYYNAFDADGTAYLRSYTSNGGLYTNYVTIVDPDTLAAQDITIPGDVFNLSDRTVGPDGTSYYRGYGTGNAAYITMIDPQTHEAHSAQLQPAGTAGYVATTYVADASVYFVASDSTVNGYRVTFIDPDDAGNPGVTVLNNMTGASIVGTTATAVYLTGADSATGQNTLIMIKRTDPQHPIIVNAPMYAQTIVGADGTAYVTSTEYQAGYITHVTVYNPADLQHPSIVDIAGEAQGPVTINADGSVTQVVQRSDKTVVAVVKTATLPV